MIILFANSFAGKINCIHSALDTGLIIQGLAVHDCPSCPVLWDRFQIMQPENVDRFLGGLRPNASLTLVHLGLLKLRAARAGLEG